MTNTYGLIASFLFFIRKIVDDGMQVYVYILHNKNRISKRRNINNIIDNKILMYNTNNMLIFRKN